MAYIEFRNIHKYFGSSHVLKGINLGVEYGQMVTLLGPSGCGKSTLLRCLAGLEQVNEGQIFLDGKDITNLTPKQRNIGMVFQQYSLFPTMTVRQNVAFGLQIQKMEKSKIDAKVKEVLEIVGLSDKIDHYPRQLSGGQQQRVALARAIVTELKVLLLDEPLSAIDALLRKNLQIEIRRIQQELNITTIFVTHDQDEAMVMSDMIHLFNVGQIEQSGTPVEIYTHPRTRFAANFIGNYNILDAAQFKTLTGAEAQAENVAIRPEVISLSAEPGEQPGCYMRKGKIVNSVPHGNIVRYTIACDDVTLRVDVLFSDAMLLAAQSEVYCSVAKENCLMLE
ncbi:MAG TPA: ABC transporter ATP-binding protein [Candidatus Agathobaculum stercoravium]|nr:ABC transporter ATP-binding protein [uncultured Agathobaculum sp.]HIV96932.1 ABC transporter ATP-binding protein [Candidatus Agathobaculum stercoravium]